MKKFLFIFLFLFISLSFSKSDINVTVIEKEGLVVRIFYKPVIYLGLVEIGNQTFFNISELQVIHVEILNIGSSSLNLKNLLLEILFFEKGRFIQLANYTDYFLPPNLLPGQLHHFNVTYAPDRLGVHNIRVKVDYNRRRATAFGSFLVTLPPIYVLVPQPPITKEVFVPKEVQLKPPVLQIIAPNQVDIFKGEIETITIIVKNVGERSVFNLRPHISSPQNFEFSISPLTIAFLEPNESAIFHLTLFVSKDVDEGIYPLSFEIVANETSASRVIYINVTELPKIIDFCEDAKNKILSFEFLMYLIRSRIYSFYLKGAYVEEVNNSVLIIEYKMKEAK
ncbi:MAG: hypothetical protein RMJ17_01965, partial [Candidatus Aenigmarchaeota archaeon]|nr:hypothetical protein [Candidatus Aenigmarchaeota archaeon]MDW8149341.1 hypothetical protein [Candidatus Aenigmarchaeota archaeon]